ncbi:MAG: hypothetical protein K0V04_37835, partial [Deltaproteobacteria bacterium]|nr:hypothetical protein [Deltaproteobacteria bacterium]
MRDGVSRYRARRCTAQSCGLRFPVAEGSELGRDCPICGASTEIVDAPYESQGVPPGRGGLPRLRMEALLDNVRSLRNVGSMFRTADGAGVSHLHLGGVTPTPEHPKLAKTALGAERMVAWSRHPDACRGAAQLSADGRRLWALEGGPRSSSLFEPEVAAEVAAMRARDQTLVLVLGHEVSGVDP